MVEKKQPAKLSSQLKSWLKADNNKSLGSFNNVFKEKAFAITFLILMALPALPLPTGGITHVTEVITALLALELIIGRDAMWLPQKWLRMDVGKIMKGKAVTKLINVIEWFEHFSRQRGARLLTLRPVKSLLGLVVLVLTVAAFVSPPFSFLDTLPSMGVVVLSLGIILEDALIVLSGIIVGAIGIGVEITAGAALYEGLKHIF